MRNPFSKRLHLPVLGFGLVLIIGSFFTYYLFYVSKQTSYFTNRNLRMLAALSNHVEEKVASLSGVFSNAAKDFAEKCEAEPKCFESLKKNDKASPDAPIVDFQSAALDVLKGDGTYLSATNIEIIAKPENGDSLPADPEIEIKQEEGKRWLYLQYTFRHTPTKPTVQVASEKNGSGAMRSEEEKSATFWTFRARTNLKDLIGPFVNQREVEENKGADHQDGLDAILIADVDNDVEVIFQESPAELHVASLRNLKLPGAEESKGDLSAISQSTSLVDVEIAGDVYKLFVQPIDLPLDKIKGDHKHGVRWLACGLIQAGHFRSESWSISYTVLTVLGFITAMVALSWPFIKLASLGPKDRLRRRDAFFLVLSTLIVTALLTFFLLYGSHYSAIEAGLDVRMKTFGGHIRRNFEEEVKAALNELDELNRKPELISAFESLKILNPVGGKSGGKRRDDERQDRPQYSEQDKEQAARDFAENKEKKNILDGPLNDVEPYPYFRSAFWVDPKGEQRIKWTVRKDVTRLVKVAERPYFTNIQRGYLQKLGPHEFVLQPLLSKTTGSNEVVISKAVYPLDRRPWWNLIGSVTPGDSPPEKWVSAIDARFLSLMEPVIPAGFGFAIIDNNGTVLFHSDEKQHLGENFFEECDNNRALRSAVVGRADDLISTQYLGKGHRIYVEPLGNSSWTLVVFRNKEYLRTAISELMTLALILFSTYFILLLLCVLLIYRFYLRRRGSGAWLWPVEDNYHRYLQCVVLVFALCVLGCVSLYLFSSWKMILAPFLLPFVGTTLFVVTLQREKGLKLFSRLGDKLKGRPFLNYRRAFTTSAVLLLILVAVIPAWASFHLAYREELRLFVKEGQINFARGMAEREDRVRELYSSANLTTIHPERVESFIARRLKENNLDVYVAFFFDTSIGTPPSEHSEYQNESENGLISFFASFVPLFDQSSIERHGLARSQSADRSWFWEEKPPDELVLHVRGALTPSHRSSPQHIVSVVPDVRPPIYWWLIWPVIILSLAILVSYLIRRIFLFHIQKPPVRLLSEYYTGGITQNLFLVLGSPFTSKSEILEDFENEKRLTIIDIQEQARKKKWAERYDFDGANSLAVVLDNFDYCHDDPAANEQKLVLLETLYQRQTRAIAISAFEPHDYLFSSGKAEEGAEENSPSPTVAEERWAGILSRFLKVRMEDVGKADKFGDLIETLETNVKKRTDLTGEDKERMETVLDIVKRECSPLACLQSTGREILKQPKFDELTPADIVIEIRAQTLTYYQALWRASTNDEKLTLSHLAQDGLLSPNDQEIEGLMRRGLIVRDPDVRIMNETFESFVMDRGQDTLIAACEKEARGNSSWQALKVPFALILGTIIVFLFVTQRDLYNSALAIVAAVTAGVPTLFKLFGSSGSNSGPSTKS